MGLKNFLGGTFKRHFLEVCDTVFWMFFGLHFFLRYGFGLNFNCFSRYGFGLNFERTLFRLNIQRTFFGGIF